MIAASCACGALASTSSDSWTFCGACKTHLQGNVASRCKCGNAEPDVRHASRRSLVTWLTCEHCGCDSHADCYPASYLERSCFFCHLCAAYDSNPRDATIASTVPTATSKRATNGAPAAAAAAAATGTKRTASDASLTNRVARGRLSSDASSASERSHVLTSEASPTAALPPARDADVECDHPWTKLIHRLRGIDDTTDIGEALKWLTEKEQYETQKWTRALAAEQIGTVRDVRVLHANLVQRLFERVPLPIVAENAIYAMRGQMTVKVESVTDAGKRLAIESKD